MNNENERTTQKEPLKEPKVDKYLGSLLQEDKIIDENDDEDDVTAFSPSSVNKYEFKFSKGDFSIDFVFPIYHKPVFDKKKNVDLVFELLCHRATHFFLMAIDENYREEYKNDVKAALDKEVKKDEI